MIEKLKQLLKLYKEWKKVADDEHDEAENPTSRQFWIGCSDSYDNCIRYLEDIIKELEDNE